MIQVALVGTGVASNDVVVAAPEAALTDLTRYDLRLVKREVLH